MRFKYKMIERKQPKSGHAFVVATRVDLDEIETQLHQAYDVYGCLVIGKEFTEVVGVDTLGDVKLDQLIGRTVEFEFPTIQMASRFVNKLGDGLWDLKKQIAETQTAIRTLDQDVELEF